MRAFLPASLALLTAAASAQVTVQPRPAPALGLSNLDCSTGLSTGRESVPDAPAAPIVRLELGGTAAAPMPNVCAEATPLAVLPEGARFRLAPVPRGLSDDELGRLRDLQFFLQPHRAQPSPEVLDQLRQRFREFQLINPQGSDGGHQSPAPNLILPPVAPPADRP